MKKIILLLLLTQLSFAGQEIIDAINNENFSQVEKLIKNKKNLDIKDQNGHDVLYLAVSLNEPQLVKKILKAGARTDQLYNDKKETLLFEATRLGSQEIVNLLLNKNPKLINIKNSDQQSIYAESIKARQKHLTEFYKSKGLTK